MSKQTIRERFMYVKALVSRTKASLLSGDAINVVFGESEKTMIAIEERMEDGARHLFVELSYEIDAPPEIVEIVKSLMPGEAWPSEKRTPAMIAFADEIREEAKRRMRVVVDVLRWRCNVPGWSRAHIAELWLSFDVQTWHKLFRADGMYAVITSIAQVPNVEKALLEGIASREPVPLSRELYHEACEMAHTHSRSCLVTLVAAAEVGFKEYLAEIVPDAAWLAMNAPSPPLVGMLKNYLPTLPAKHRKFGLVEIPKRIRNLIEKAVKRRNDLVHRGAAKFDQQFLADFKTAVSDLLYLLDMYRGHQWAWDMVTPNTQYDLHQASRALKTNAKQQDITATASTGQT